ENARQSKLCCLSGEANHFEARAGHCLYLLASLCMSASADLAKANSNDPTPGRNIMAMLTPTPFMMRPNSFEHLALLHNFLRNFSGLRLTLGTVLRMTADIGSLWIAFLFGWLIVDGNDLAALTARDS